MQENFDLKKKQNPTTKLKNRGLGGSAQILAGFWQMGEAIHGNIVPE